MSQKDPNQTFNRVFIGLGIVLFSIGISMTGLGSTLLGTSGPSGGNAVDNLSSAQASGATTTPQQSTEAATTAGTTTLAQTSLPTQLSTLTPISSTISTPTDTTPNQTDIPPSEPETSRQDASTTHDTRTTIQSGSGEVTTTEQESVTITTEVPNRSKQDFADGEHAGETHPSSRDSENHPDEWTTGDSMALFTVCFGVLLLVSPTVYSHFPL